MELKIYIQNWLDSMMDETSTLFRTLSWRKGLGKVKSLHRETITTWITKFITFKTPFLPYKGNEKRSRKVLDNSWKANL